MKKKLLYVSVICTICSILLAYLNSVELIMHMVKCLLLAYGIVIATYAVLSNHINKRNSFLYYFAVILIALYTSLLFDTYLVHAISWFPGIIRYALFSTYGWWYLVFILPGIGLCFSKAD